MSPLEPLYDDILLNAARQSDEAMPGRICAWCFHPRNSDECQFAAKHEPYMEMFV